ncbi:MAG: hypothetical protein GY697_01560 [Desulfobacterales bacterium]|nr:hypothetical protein [Desulfobacterales bacterium]
MRFSIILLLKNIEYTMHIHFLRFLMLVFLVSNLIPTEARSEEWVFLNRNHIVGDINGNGQVGLEDAILAQQILSNIDTNVPIYLEADVNQDGNLGFTELIFSLQSTAGLMPYLSYSGICPDGTFCIRNPLPTVNDFYDAIHAKGKYVLVGRAGTIFISSKRATAGLTSSSTNENLFSIAYGNDHFIAVGNYGTVARSTDGINWTATNLAEAGATGFRGVAFGNNTFICVGGGSVFYSLDNGSTWQGNQIVDPNQDGLSDAIYENNQFVVIGTGGKIFTSPNGIDWTERFIPEVTVKPNFRHIVYGEDGFVASDAFGTIYKSADAVTWEDGFYVGEHSDDMAFGNGIYVTVNRTGLIATSDDAEVWNEHSDTHGLKLHSVSFANDKFIGTGDAGRIFESSDGINWVELSESITNNKLTFIAFGNNRFIASEYRDVLISSQDGKIWSKIPSVPANLFARDLTFIDDKFYVLSDDKLHSSSDGNSWTSITLPCDGHKLIYANGLYVVIGYQSKIITSSDAIAWTEVWAGDPFGFLYGVGYGNNEFIASYKSGTGANYVILTSDDGLTWENMAEIAFPLTSFTYANDFFVASSTYGRIYSSADGLTWINRKQGDNSTVSRILFNEDGYTAVGFWERPVPWGSEWFSKVYNSPDGITWTEIILAMPGLSGIAKGQNSYVMVGTSGSILQYTN